MPAREQMCLRPIFLCCSITFTGDSPLRSRILSPRPDRGDVHRLDHLAAGAAFGIEKPEQVLKRLGVCRIPQPLFVLSHVHQAFHPELLEVMRKRRVWYIELGLNVADDHPVRMSRQKQPHYLKSGLGAQCREHIRVPGCLSTFHITRILEIPIGCQELSWARASAP